MYCGVVTLKKLLSLVSHGSIQIDLVLYVNCSRLMIEEPRVLRLK